MGEFLVKRYFIDNWFYTTYWLAWATWYIAINQYKSVPPRTARWLPPKLTPFRVLPPEAPKFLFIFLWFTYLKFILWRLDHSISSTPVFVNRHVAAEWTPGDAWGRLGTLAWGCLETPGDAWGRLGTPRDACGRLGTPGDAWGCLGTPGIWVIGVSAFIFLEKGKVHAKTTQ